MNEKFNEIIFGNVSKIKGDKLYVNEFDFEIPHGKDYEIAIKELSEIQKYNIDGINFLELFQYNDFSMWWFVFPTIYPKILIQLQRQSLKKFLKRMRLLKAPQ